jgi:hypothetical protein
MVIHRPELSTAEDILIKYSRFPGGKGVLYQRLVRFIVRYGGFCVRAWGFYVSGWGRNVSYGGRLFRIPAGLRRAPSRGGSSGNAEGGASCGLGPYRELLGAVFSYRELWGALRIVRYWGRLSKL